jgi:hypothetical protein
MFLDELTPIVRELTSQPVAFVGGFFAGMLRLKLTDEPIKSWLDRQAGISNQNSYLTPDHNGKSGPQSISID